MKEMKAKKPDWMKNHSPKGEILLDLRRFLRHGLEPLPEIEGILRELRPCQVLHLTCAQDPVLLYGILAPLGFEHYTRRRGKVWDIYFRNCGWNPGERETS